MTEPTMIIGDRALTNAQAMAVRVALSDFYASLSDPVTLGDDEHGRAMTDLYRQRVAEVLALMNSPAAGMRP